MGYGNRNPNLRRIELPNPQSEATGRRVRRGGAGFQGAVMNVGLRVQIGHRQTVTSAHVMVSCISWFGHNATFPGFRGTS